MLLPAEAKEDLLAGAFVCRHKAGSWNAVSADQFGDQTAIKIGEGGLKGITLSSTQVAEWIDSFPISAHVSDTLDNGYSPDLSSSSSEMLHKGRGVKRCKFGEDDRQRISTKLGQFSHTLEIESYVLYNIHNGQVAPTIVNVSDSLAIESLPIGFHAKLSSPVNTTGHLKRGVKIGDKVVFDLEFIFVRLLVVVQQRKMELLQIFWYELCPSITYG